MINQLPGSAVGAVVEEDHAVKEMIAVSVKKIDPAVRSRWYRGVVIKLRAEWPVVYCWCSKHALVAPWKSSHKHRWADKRTLTVYTKQPSGITQWRGSSDPMKFFGVCKLIAVDK